MVWFKIQGRNSHRAKVCQIPPTHTAKFVDRMIEISLILGYVSIALAMFSIGLWVGTKS